MLNKGHLFWLQRTLEIHISILGVRKLQGTQLLMSTATVQNQTPGLLVQCSFYKFTLPLCPQEGLFLFFHLEVSLHGIVV